MSVVRMRPSKPFFSIVMPTRNRASLLEFSLKSAMSQTFEDYEIVVCNNHSDDGTEEVVKQIKDHRVRYVKTDRVLGMPDSWEFALNHADGEYITYLCDDDAISSFLLQSIYQVICNNRVDIVAWPFGATYYHNSWHDPQMRNSVILTEKTSVVQEVEADKVLEYLFKAQFTHMLPRLLNSCVHRNILTQIKDQIGRVFWPTCPDYTSGMAQLAICNRLVFIDDLLLIWGVGDESIGAASGRKGKASETFLNELKVDNSHELKHVPLSFLLPMNHAVDSVLKMKSKFTDRFKEFSLDLNTYYLMVRHELSIWEANGVNIENELRDYHKALAKELWTIQFQVYMRNYLSKANKLGRGIAHQVINQVLPVFRPTRIIKNHHCLTMNGEERGFTNIYECIQYLDRTKQTRN